MSNTGDGARPLMRISSSSLGSTKGPARLDDIQRGKSYGESLFDRVARTIDVEPTTGSDG